MLDLDDHSAMEASIDLVVYFIMAYTTTPVKPRRVTARHRVDRCRRDVGVLTEKLQTLERVATARAMAGTQFRARRRAEAVNWQLKRAVVAHQNEIVVWQRAVANHRAMTGVSNVQAFLGRIKDGTFGKPNPL
ncbi:Aste57867_9874 [Aphanomyces stellatus]|uniref:Aste57867_9874 protein n=1 Tax=Aphanomyces stellatus TaxID=120398 RepID=A0A485KP08_9STRA|nr:hypothetical protein As57867_009835 [Aphanomyces stellatus]VFT86753.1 Aste57867_9874 [Aphanomyces stellatus]